MQNESGRIMQLHAAAILGIDEAEAEADGVVHVDNCSDDSQDQEDAAARIKNIHAGRN